MNKLIFYSITLGIIISTTIVFGQNQCTFCNGTNDTTTCGLGATCVNSGSFGSSNVVYTCRGPGYAACGFWGPVKKPTSQPAPSKRPCGVFNNTRTTKKNPNSSSSNDMPCFCTNPWKKVPANDPRCLTRTLSCTGLFE